MTVEEALEIIERVVELGHLNKVQEIVFRQAWEGESYTEIARRSGYELGYVRDVGSKLWQLLSKAFGKKITKNNFQGVLKQKYIALYLTPVGGGTYPTGTPLNGNATQSQPASPADNIFGKFGQGQDTTNQLVTGGLYQRQGWAEALDISDFYGRIAELATLKQWIVQDRCRLVSLVGMGGIGKTALAVKLAEQLQDQFEYVIWRSLRNAPPLQDLLEEVILFLSDQQNVHLPAPVDSQISYLMGYLRQHCCLLVLDNVESILQSGERTGRYCEGYEGYGQLLRRVGDERHQSCLVLTSREKPIGLTVKEGKSLLRRSLQLTGLQQAEGQAVLKDKGLEAEDVSKLIELYAGNPLMLKAAATMICSLFDGSVSRFLEQDTVVFGDIWDLLDRQFNRLSILEKEVMCLLARAENWVTLPELQASVASSVSRRELLEGLESLHQRSLIKKATPTLIEESGQFTQQPIVREYVTERLCMK